MKSVSHSFTALKHPMLAGAVLAAAMVASLVAQATTITLNLNALATGNFTSPLSVDGFTLTPFLGSSSVPSIVNVGGTNTLQSGAVSAQGADTLLTRNGGGLFTLVSVDIAALNGDGPGTGYGIGITNIDNAFQKLYGYYFTGTALSSSFVTQDYSAVTGFANTTTIDLDPVNVNGGFAIANITVSFDDVPEPATLAVMGAGLAGLSLLRRRKRA